MSIDISAMLGALLLGILSVFLFIAVSVALVTKNRKMLEESKEYVSATLLLLIIEYLICLRTNVSEEYFSILTFFLAWVLTLYLFLFLIEFLGRLIGENDEQKKEKQN